MAQSVAQPPPYHREPKSEKQRLQSEYLYLHNLFVKVLPLL